MPYLALYPQQKPPHPAVAFDHGTSYPLQLVVVDLAGPVTPRSLGGKSYIMGILDVFTRHSWVYFLSHKSQAAEKLKEWIAVAEHQCGKKTFSFEVRQRWRVYLERIHDLAGASWGDAANNSS